jgi:hypothetical protein
MNQNSSVIMWAIGALIIGGIAGYVIGTSAAPNGANQMSNPSPMSAGSSASATGIAFNKAMRQLWEDHITWTRLYIVEAVAGNPGVGQTAARLLKNQEDIGNAIKSYYGNAAGDQLTALLKEHIQGAVDILNAAKANDTQKLATAKTAWYDNANQIAAFLNGANPNNWPLAAMQAHMKEHLDLTLQEAVDELQGNYSASIADYDKVHPQILGLADTLSAGIIAQFPDKFK